MNPFTYSRVVDSNEAVTGIAAKPQGKFLGGGTNLIDLMKMGVETPNELVDINRLPLAQIEELPDKGVRIGAMARNSDVAEHELIKTRYPVLSQALLSGASPQLRNMATVGGNLMQRTRCAYFRDTGVAQCNKRAQGPGGTRAIPVTDFHTVPGQHPEVETVLAPGELITHLVLPHAAFTERSQYVKVRDRASFAFALAS